MWCAVDVEYLVMLVLLGIMTIPFTAADTKWASGYFGLPQPLHGCPSSIGFTWNNAGWLLQERKPTNDTSSRVSPLFHLKVMATRYSTRRYFCMKTSNASHGGLWPAGQYCIYRALVNAPCPPGFEEGTIRWNNKVIDHQYPVPYGVYNIIVKISYCCRVSGDKRTAITLPINRPFVLIAYNSSECQTVRGATATQEYLRFSRQDYPVNGTTGGKHPFIDGNYSIHYCYYRAKPPPPTATTTTAAAITASLSTRVTTMFTTTNLPTATTTTTTATTTTTEAVTTTTFTTTRNESTSAVSSVKNSLSCTSWSVTVTQSTEPTTDNSSYGSSQTDHKSDVVLAVVIPVSSVFFIGGLFLVIFLCRKRKGLYRNLERNDIPEMESGDDDASLLDLNMDRVSPDSVVVSHGQLVLMDSTAERRLGRDSAEEELEMEIDERTPMIERDPLGVGLVTIYPQPQSTPPPSRYTSDPDPNHSTEVANEDLQLG